MLEFFYNEFKMLKALTGFNQWEKLNDGPDPEKAIREIIDLMIIETKRDPFKIVKPEVVQRVIHDAILNDGEFTGLNAKFVRKALNAWWNVYGLKIIEARDQKDPNVYEKKPLDPEADARVNVLLKSFERSIKNGVFQQVPKISPEEVQEQGQERPKAHIYRSTDISYQKQIEEKIIEGRRRYFKENYPNATEEDLINYLNSF